MKCISFSLWGNNPKYTIGAIKNLELAQEIYPDWICRFYVGIDVPKNIINDIEKFSNSEIILMNEQPNWEGMFWRFYAIEDCDVFISRDTDSRLSAREKSAVDQWIQSDKNIHIMRDHPYHNYPILGGMWGAKKPILNNIKNLIKEYKKGNFWQVDQNFLRDIVYPIVKNDALVHDEFFEKKSFPTKRDGLNFIGQIFDENDKPVIEHQIMLKNHLMLTNNFKETP